MSRAAVLLAVAVCAMALAVPGAVAATSHEAIVDVLQTQVAVKRTEMMARAALLPRAESDAFWPLYREYERERERLEGRARALLEDYLNSAGTLDDATAQALLDRLFDLYEQRLALLRKYATALQARLPMRQAAEFVQTEFELLRLLDLERDARLGLMR
jgi:Spy/CpxP family protein refolding chaperone